MWRQKKEKFEMGEKDVNFFGLKNFWQLNNSFWNLKFLFSDKQSAPVDLYCEGSGLISNYYQDLTAFTKEIETQMLENVERSNLDLSWLDKILCRVGNHERNLDVFPRLLNEASNFVLDAISQLKLKKNTPLIGFKSN